MNPALAEAVWQACVAEATARKPGNVHPGAAFADLTYTDFVQAAHAIAPILACAASQTVGQTVRLAVEATHARTRTNVNLGIILLLTPLAKAWLSQDLRAGLHAVLTGLTRDDARDVYAAIRLARPGGLGQTETQDVAHEPTCTLTEAMRLAAERDGVARQYVTDFADVFEIGVPALTELGDDFGLPAWEAAIVRCGLRLLAARPDTLIARKCGSELAAQAAAQAQAVLDGTLSLDEFDTWLRADGHRRNPGTTADLVAASLLAWQHPSHSTAKVSSSE